MGVQSEVIRFHGHSEIRATHGRTIELTREEHLTANGDCIVGVGADRGLVDLSHEFVRRIRSGVPVRFTIDAGGESFSFGAAGDSRLGLSNRMEMVIRKSGYICGRTLAVRSDAAAINLPRRMVSRLQRDGTEGTLTMEVDG